nr:immunoglobulin light chain junction region [Macaca mulatta]MOY07197.1 immunoglobulin light chain junction region [Macaca mulatta]MOY07225.1 immunoglobulin light chain junction region [Macaca mulatta]
DYYCQVWDSGFTFF